MKKRGKCDIIKEHISIRGDKEKIFLEKIYTQMHRGTCTEMAHTADSYYTINRNLLLCIGLWPYQRLSFRCILIILMTMLLISSVVFQV